MTNGTEVDSPTPPGGNKSTTPRDERSPGESQPPPAGLAYLANFERLVITLSGRFINLGPDELDQAIRGALEAIGGFADVDRSYVFLFSPDGERVSNTHEWCADGIASGIDDVQNIPVEQFSWAMPRFKRGEVVHIPDVSKLPSEAEREKRTMQAQGVRSLINLPLRCGGRTLGFVGFDSVRSRKTWREDHIKLLKVVGEIIAGAIDRARTTQALRRQVRLEKLVADISSRFINLPSGALDREIGRAIERIGAFTGVDRSYLFQFTADGHYMNNTHEWCAPGIEPCIEQLQGHPISAFGYSMARMRRGEVFHVPRVSDLPAEAHTEKREFEREGIRTLINVPMMARGSMIGFLGFDAVHNHITWSDDDIRLLRLVAEILANALERKSAEERLQASLREKEVLLREIHHRVKNNLQVVHSLLYLQANAIAGEVDPVALDAFRHSQARIKSMAAIHDRLYRAVDLAKIDFDDYLHALIPDLLRLYPGSERISVHMAARGAHLSIDTAIPCGLIVNELVTNSLEHAFADRRAGRIDVSLAQPDGGPFELVVADDGIGFPPGMDWRNRKTLGLQLVSDLVSQIDGDVAFETDGGTRYLIRFGNP
jgi:two-component sensor histidine kinase